MFILPNRDGKKWVQSNSSDISGTLQRTRNIDFSQEGYAKLAKRARCISDQSVLNGDGGVDFGRIQWIEYYQPTLEYWYMTRGGIFSVNATTLAITEQSATANVPTADTNCRNDCVPWQGYLYATSTVTLRRYNGTWSTNQYAAGITNAGYLAVHEQKNALAISQGNQVLLIDTSHVLLATLNLPSDFVVTSMDYSNGYIIVGTRNTNNQEAKVFRWSGNTAVADYDHGVGSSRVCSVRKYGNSFVAMSGKGSLLSFNGGGFDVLDSFPIASKYVDWDYDGSSFLGRIINRGMKVDGLDIYINLSPRLILPAADTASHVFENWFEGGVWCYTPSVRLHHRYCHTSSIRVSNTIATGSVDTTNDLITVTSAPESGTPVLYDSSNSTVLGGLTNRVKYYAIYVSPTTIKLATSRINALNGTAIDLTGTGNSSQLLIFLPNRDFGGSTLGGNGLNVDAGCAITLVGNREAVYRTNAYKVMFGTRLGKTTVNGDYGLAVASFGQENRGVLITPKLSASGIVDTFHNITVKFRGVTTPEVLIVVKYRNIERNDNLTGIDQALSMTATWLNNYTFTTTADLSAAKKGDEISFHSGTGSGYMAHISSISLVSTTYIVVIDEVIQNCTAGETVGFVIENWNKQITTVTTADVDHFTNDNQDRYDSNGGSKTFNLLKPSKWMEIKLEIRGEDVAVEELLVNGKPYKTFIV